MWGVRVSWCVVMSQGEDGQVLLAQSEQIPCSDSWILDKSKRSRDQATTHSTRPMCQTVTRTPVMNPNRPVPWEGNCSLHCVLNKQQLKRKTALPTTKRNGRAKAFTLQKGLDGRHRLLNECGSILEKEIMYKKFMFTAPCHMTSGDQWGAEEPRKVALQCCKFS